MLLTNRTIDVFRLTRSAGRDTYPNTPEITGLAVAIHPATTEIAALYPGTSLFGQFQVFTEGLDLLATGDKLVDDRGRTFILKGMPNTYDLGLFDYQWFLAEVSL